MMTDREREVGTHIEVNENYEKNLKKKRKNICFQALIEEKETKQCFSLLCLRLYEFWFYIYLYICVGLFEV